MLTDEGAVLGKLFQVAVEKVKAAPPLAEAKRVELAKILESVDVQTFYGRVKFATEGEFYPAKKIVVSWPTYAEVMEKGLGHFFHDPSKADPTRVFRN